MINKELDQIRRMITSLADEIEDNRTPTTQAVLPYIIARLRAMIETASPERSPAPIAPVQSRVPAVYRKCKGGCNRDVSSEGGFNGWCGYCAPGAGGV